MVTMHGHTFFSVMEHNLNISVFYYAAINYLVFTINGEISMDHDHVSDRFSSMTKGIKGITVQECIHVHTQFKSNTYRNKFGIR